MPRATPLQPSLNAGEFSPRMVARTDFAKYPLACATLENLIPLPQGGAARRPGTMFVAEVKDSTRTVKLRPFEFSTLQAYVLECGEGCIRFYRDHGRIEAAPTDAVIANGTFDSNIAGWTNLSGAGSSIAHDAANHRLSLVSNGSTNAHAEQAVAVNAAYQASEHVLRFRVFGAAGDTVKLRIGIASTGTQIVNDVEFAVGWHAYAFTPGAATVYVQFLHGTGKTLQIDDVALIADAPVEVGAPWAESDLFAVKQAQSADVLYLCQSGHPVHKLTRSGHSSWSLVEVVFADGPWNDENTTSTTLTPATTGGLGVTVTASSTAGINRGAGFGDDDIGRPVRLDNASSGADWGWGRIVARLSATQVNIDIKRGFSTTNATTHWRLGAWSGASGWPAAVTFFEQRLCFAATDDRPQTFWLSQSADFENMSPDSPDATSGKWNETVEDDDAIDFTISADQVNAIRWMAPGRNLFVGTVGGEWTVTSEGSTLTPVDIDVKRQTTFGVANLPPAVMRGRLMFLQRAGRKVLEFAYALEQDNFQAHDMTVLAEHVTRGGIVDLAYQQEPDSVLWTVRADGELPTLTYMPDQDVIGWARCRLGGAYGAGAAACETVCVIPAVDRDEVWLCAARTIGGQTKRYVEYLAVPFESGADPAAACYADSALMYQGTAVDSIAGLGHLEGQTVAILADGAVHPSRVVTAGVVALDYPAATVVAGLPYAHAYESLKWEAGAAIGTAQGQTKRIHGVTLMLLDSGSFEIGPDPARLKTVPFRTVDGRMDAAVPLFTGERFVPFDGDFDTDTRVLIRGADPSPFTLLALAPEIKTNSR